MTQQSKSYRYGKSMAPYRQRVVINSGSNGPSFFKKMKSLFNGDQSTNKTRRRREDRIKNHDEDSLPKIPGGFFTTDHSKVETNAKSSGLKQPEKDRCVSSNVTQSGIGDDTEDEFENANTSNAKLAEFFSKKGDEPLTDIEMEGVLSLMRKASRSGSSRKRPMINTGMDDSMTSDSFRVLKSSRTPSMVASSYKAPTFTARYEDSIGSQSLGNASLRSTSSRRRVFDYASFPTPYKTVVYRYSAADGSNGVKAGRTVSVTDASHSDLDLPSSVNEPPTHRLSNTASALVSLLDGNSATKSITSVYSNPYSSYNDPIREYKKNASQLSKSVPEASNTLRSEALENIQGAKEEPVSQILPKQRQKAVPKAPSEKYKPARSSSLRSSIVPTEEASEKEDEQEVQKPAVPAAACFSFTLEGKSNKEKQPRMRMTDQPLFPVSGEPSDVEKLPSHVSKPDPSKQEKKEPAKFSFTGVEQFTHSAAESTRQQVDSKSDLHSEMGIICQNSLRPGPERFDFGDPLPSKANANLIDAAKVEKFKSSYIF